MRPPRPGIRRGSKAWVVGLCVAALSSHWLLHEVTPAEAQTTNPAAPEEPTLEQRLQQLLAGGRYAEAEELLRRLGDGGSVRALLALARLEAGRGRAEDAAGTLRKALDLAPNAEDVLSGFARVHLGAGRPGPALQALEGLARMHPEVAEHAYLLGVARLQLGDLDGAAESLARTIELDPTEARHHLARGLALNQLKRFAEAETSLRRALALAPESTRALAALAEAEEGLGRRDAAEQHARSALAALAASREASSTAPGDSALSPSPAVTAASAAATAHFVLGRLHMQAGEHAAARDAFLRALATADDAAKVHYQLSLAYARLGDHELSRLHRDDYTRLLREADRRLAALQSAPPLTARDSTAPHLEEGPE
ncbi:MAG: tetratricopeptide repeat protein [Acidobacteriota bacterium]